MVILVSGGSGSGKSQLAENLCVKLKEDRLYYVATMKVWDEECARRIEKHRRQRAGKGFVTAEIPEDLFQRADELESGACVLVECMSNLAANEQFGGKDGDPAQRIISGLKKLFDMMDSVVIVSNEVFTDGTPDDPAMREYMEYLGEINCFVASVSDMVIEVTSGVPVIWKGENIYREIFV